MSPLSLHFSHRSSETLRSSETVSSSTSESAPLTTPRRLSGLPPSPSPLKTKGRIAPEARMMVSATDTFGVEDEDEDDDDGGNGQEERPRSPSIRLSESPVPMPGLTLAHPLLTPLQPYIAPVDPTSHFTDFVEIAEGESGSVFAARTSRYQAGTSHVAIKRIPLPPPSSSPSMSEHSPLSSKLSSLLHELILLKDVSHEHLLVLDAVYVGPSSDDKDGTKRASALDTSLWIRMELMERSLADVIGLVTDGLALQERMVARFSSDVLHGLEYLQKQHIAHRDVRSDNLLLNASGVVKLADFSNAIRVTRNEPTAPEMRAGPYNALKVDIWSLGATVWELAETVPPFSMPTSPSTETAFSIQSARHVGSQWPPLTHPEHYSRGFHEFLKLCGREAAMRPGPGELLNTPFIRNACGRAVILQLLSQCRSIEEVMVAREAAGSRS
ncbi:kinase-like domain-containing protein [Melanogaster broomeanus]|nr:kinase-like domain-containing protein [Melanogaster broomeanus]